MTVMHTPGALVNTINALGSGLLCLQTLQLVFSQLSKPLNEASIRSEECIKIEHVLPKLGSEASRVRNSRKDAALLLFLLSGRQRR